jgi:hypothetical protein
MRYSWLGAVAVLALGAAPVSAQVAIKNVQAAHGPLGPVRETLDCYPREEVCFRYLLTGLEADPEGKVSGELTLTVTDARGQVFLTTTNPVGGPLPLGGGTMPGSASVTLPPSVAAGVYTVTLRVKDNRSSQSAEFSRKLNLRRTEFAIVSPRFFHDRERTVPAPGGGLLGQTLAFQLQVIGCDRSQGKIDALMQVTVLDSQGKEVKGKGVEARLRVDDLDKVRRATVLTFTGDLSLNRVGRFTLRIRVTDRLGRQSAMFEAPLHVRAP